jgi:dTDP-glucose 4,6-dehydratase/UDP-glucose 4-epimerase
MLYRIFKGIVKILIIGSKGFIGAHCFHFFESKYETWGCDVFTDYNEKNFFLIDTLNPSYHSLFQNNNFDVCINCAGAASVPDSLKHPERDYELNVHLVYRLLNAIRLYSPDCKFINISSAAVYGNPQTLPVREDHLLNPVSPYGLHKVYAEQICKEFTTHFALKACSIRIFSAYGPGLKKQIFWDLFMKSKNDRINLFGSGNETRDYIYVSDIVNAVDCIIMNASFDGECFNLGYGKQYALKEVSRCFFDFLHWNGELTFSGEKRLGDPDYWEADITKLKNIGFRPAVSITEGLKKYAEWVKGIPLD